MTNDYRIKMPLGDFELEWEKLKMTVDNFLENNKDDTLRRRLDKAAEVRFKNFLLKDENNEVVDIYTDIEVKNNG